MVIIQWWIQTSGMGGGGEGISKNILLAFRAPPLDRPLYFSNDFSPYANKSRTVLDFGFQEPDSLSVELEFRIPIVSDIPDSLS